MKPKKLFLLLCLLVIASWWMVSRSNSPQATLKNYLVPTRPLFHLQENEITKIVVFRQTSQLILQLVKEDELYWRMKDPVVDRADYALIRQAIFQVLAAEKSPPEALWKNKPDSELGLAPPKITLEFYTAQRTYVLRVGAKSLDGQHYAAELNGERCRVPVNLISWFNRDERLWRDHGLLRSPGSVLSIQWNPLEGPEVSLFRSAEGWRITAPKEGFLKSNLVGSLMSLLGSRIDTLPQDPMTEEGKTAVKKLAGKLSVFYSEKAHRGGVEDQTIWITPDFVMEDSRDFHLPVRPDSLQFLGHPAADLFSQRFLALKKSHLASIEIQSRTERKIFRRHKGSWKLAGSGNADLEASRAMSTLLSEISTARSLPEKRNPGSAPDFTLRLSISANPNVPGSVLLNAWTTAEGILLENPQGGQCTLLPKERLQDLTQ